MKLIPLDAMLDVLGFLRRSDLDTCVIATRCLRSLIDEHFRRNLSLLAVEWCEEAAAFNVVWIDPGKYRSQRLFEGRFADGLSVLICGIRYTTVKTVKICATWKYPQAFPHSQWRYFIDAGASASLKCLSFEHIDLSPLSSCSGLRDLSLLSFTYLDLSTCRLRASQLDNAFLIGMNRAEIMVEFPNKRPTDGPLYRMDSDGILDFCMKAREAEGSKKRLQAIHFLKQNNRFFPRLIEVC